MFSIPKNKIEYIEKKKRKFENKKYIPKFIRRYFERHYFMEMWHKTKNWLLTEQTVFDDKLQQESGVVHVVLYNGKCIRNMGIIGQALGYSPCDASTVIWSNKAIYITTEAMWEELRLEVIEPEKTLTKSNEYIEAEMT